jgi:exodeoxyribonuclease-3
VKENTVKIVTWNVNSVSQRIDRLVAFLGREQPDFVCLQELKGADEKFPLDTIVAAGYHAEVFGQKGYNGVAILSHATKVKSPPVKVVRNFGDGVEDSSARFIAGTWKLENAEERPLTVISAYIPNGQSVGSEKYIYKLEWFQRLRKYLDTHHKPDDLIALTGDFNVAPADIDVYDPVSWREHIHTSTRERQGLHQVASFGLVDTFRNLYPDDPGYSWWDYRQLSFPQNKGLRIDLIYATRPMAEICRGCRVDRNERKGEKPSDHAPVIAEFQWS